MKIYVYAICKNEAKFVDKFMESALESDGVFVLDTGSTDDTEKLLIEKGAYVKRKEFSFFRFDEARNEALKMLPKDATLCVSFDLDEYFVKGWRKKLEKAFSEGVTRIRYTYHWQVDENGQPVISYYYDKIHALKDYKWIYPVHEILLFSGKKEKYATADIELIHKPDPTKSRSSYLPLLLKAVEENPFSARCTHYLGREYMYAGDYDNALKWLKMHTLMKDATWKDELSASFRFIGRIYKTKKDYTTSRLFYREAIAVAPHLRDSYIELALLEDELKNYGKVILLVNTALAIKNNNLTYINEPFSFNETPFDLLSVAYFYLGDYVRAKENIVKALKINPASSRLKANFELINAHLNS